VKVGVIVPVAVGVWVGVEVGVRVKVAVGVPLGVAVEVAATVWVSVGVGVQIPVLKTVRWTFDTRISSTTPADTPLPVPIDTRRRPLYPLAGLPVLVSVPTNSPLRYILAPVLPQVTAIWLQRSKAIVVLDVREKAAQADATRCPVASIDKPKVHPEQAWGCWPWVANPTLYSVG
jgi:hypothetical protein